MTHRFLFLLISFLFIIATSAGCSNSNKVPLKIGDQAPLFSAIDIEGASTSLSDFKGQPVVIRFFLTDCKFCEADTPVFNAYYEKNKSKGLKMLYINSTAEDDSKVKEFTEMLKIPFPVIIDKEKKIADSYQIKALPQTVILSPDHKIKAAMLGGVSEEELDSVLADYLQ
jgi:peroxiredoxin